jgi:hypothetical protein
VTEETVFIASKIKDAEVWLPRFLVQLEQLDLPNSKVAFMYAYSQDKSFSYIDHYRKVSRHDVSIYGDPYLPPDERHGAKLARVKKDIQRLLEKSGCDYYFNIDCDVVNIPPDTVKKLLAHDKDVIAAMVWTEGRNPPVFFDVYEFRMDGARFHPLNPPGITKEEPFQVDSVSTCYLATAEAEIEGVYQNPYPHIPWSEDLLKKGYEIWVDPKTSVWHIDLERLGMGRQALPIAWSLSPYITETGRLYNPRQVAAQLYHLSIGQHFEWLINNNKKEYIASRAFLSSRPLITASYKVFNSDDYLKQSLESIYPYVDCIDIVEGAIKLRKWEGTTSIDNTVQLIKDFPDPDNKIRLLQGVFRDKQHIQAKLLEICRSKWMLFIDADEIIEGMEDVRKFAEENSEGQKVYARPKKFVNFVHDFEHVIFSSNPLSPWAETGMPHPFLIYRDIPGLNFGRFHTIPMDGFEVPIHSDNPEYRGRRQVLDDVLVYHFGNVLSKKKLAAKLEFERARGLGWRVDDVTKEKELVTDNFLFTGVLPDDMSIIKFEKSMLPEPMKTHPRFNDNPLIEHFIEDEVTKFKFI